MRALCREMARRGAARMAWQAPAGSGQAAAFYEACGATAQEEWRIFRLVVAPEPLAVAALPQRRRSA